MISCCKRFFGHPGVSLPISFSLLMVGAALVFVHALTIRQVKELGLPAALQLPQMQKRLAMLTDQVEASELQAALGDGSAAEQLRVSVLPVRQDLTRLLATFDMLRDSLQHDRLMTSMSSIHIGAQQPVEGISHLQAVPVTFEAEVSQEGMDTLLLLLRLAGKLTISDALSPEELSDLVDLTEQENPAALSVLEQFLSVDLLRYVREPATYENQVLRSLTSSAFEKKFAELIAHSTLAKARYLFGGTLGELLLNHNLWPMQMLSLQSVRVTLLPGGTYRLALAVNAYVRPQ